MIGLLQFTLFTAHFRLIVTIVTLMTPQKNYLNLNLIQNYLGIPFNGVFV